MRTYLLPLCAALAASMFIGAVRGQQRAPLQNTSVIQSGYVLLQHDDADVLVGRGDAYRASFTADGVRFEPALPGSPQLEHVQLRAERCGRGELLPLPLPGEPQPSGNRVEYRRGAVVEAYDVRADGIEQSFVFETLPPGEGDLVVEVAIGSSLPLRTADERHVAFVGDHGGVRIAGVVGIDASGRRGAGSMAWRGHHLELRLPAAFVRMASLPLVLDPLVNTIDLLPGNATRISGLELSYDATTNTYLTVWSFALANSSRELRGVLTNGSNLIGSPILLQGTIGSGPIGIANSNYRDSFVVAWSELLTQTNPPATYSAIRARSVAPSGALGAINSLVGTATAPRTTVQLISNALSTSSLLKMVCINGGTTLPVGELWTLAIDAAGGLSASNVQVVSSQGSACTTIGIQRVENLNRAYLVGWGEASVLNQYRVSFNTFNGNGAAQATVRSYGTPSRVSSLQIDGDGLRQEWAIGMLRADVVRDLPFFNLLWRDPNGPSFREQGAWIGLEEQNGTDSLAVALTPRLLHTVHQSRRQSPCYHYSVNCYHSTASVWTRTTCSNCVSHVDFAETAVAAMVRPAAYGAATLSPDAVKLVYYDLQDPLVTTFQPLRMGDFTPADGAITDLGGGCGGLSVRASSQCARVGGIEHLATLQGAPNNMPVFLLVGTERADLSGCGTCVLVPDPFTSHVFGPIQSPSASQEARVSFTIPNDAGLIGYRLFEQWWIPNPTNPGCPAYSVDLSNAVQIVIE